MGEICCWSCHYPPLFKVLATTYRDPYNIQRCMNMATSAIKTCKSVDPKEELLIDLDVAINETKLTLGSLNQIKQTMLNNSNIISDSFCSSLSRFTFKPTFPFPKFVHWAVENYAPSTRQILSSYGTRVIVTINPKTLRKAFCLPIRNPNYV